MALIILLAVFSKETLNICNRTACCDKNRDQVSYGEFDASPNLLLVLNSVSDTVALFCLGSVVLYANFSSQTLRTILTKLDMHTVSNFDLFFISLGQDPCLSI